tara:strand:- start:189 stop:992 length:804 start_codon:yes stop_codon:yes gene_type:complete
MTRITTDDGVGLEIVVSGRSDGPDLMFCNSLGTDHRMWDGQAEHFGETHRIIRYDRRGHGRSDVPPGPYSFERLGRDALAVVDALSVGKVWFCGLSMGGMTGMWLAANVPERFRGFALCNTGAYMPPYEMWTERINLSRAGHLDRMVEKVLERWLTAEFRKTHPDAVARVREHYLETPPEGYAACCEAIRDLDQRESIKFIRAPVMVLAGAEDPATTPAHGKLIADSVPGARYVELAAAAHLSNIERPDAFNFALADFIDAHKAVNA